jgi:predicted transcriptional regulator
MAKTYYITESQFKGLVEKKKQDAKIYKEICEEIDKKRGSLTEGKQLNEDIVKTIKGYLRAGALSASILAALLGAQKVDQNQLQQAGVPNEMVQQAQQQTQQQKTQQIQKNVTPTIKPIAPNQPIK